MNPDLMSPEEKAEFLARRQRLFDEWLSCRLAEERVRFGEYAEMREAGTWNDYARQKLGGRFTVEEG